jgi:CRP-like cAMP-binding protein
VGMSQSTKRRGADRHAHIGRHIVLNRLLTTLGPNDRAAIEDDLELVDLTRGSVLFRGGDDVEMTHFPSAGTLVCLTVSLVDGRNVQVATIGCEGAAGGIVSSGNKPAFGDAVVEIPGPALRIETARLEAVKERSTAVRDLFSRYADALLAQVMQSVACNAVHTVEERFCRWLLTTHDRVGRLDIMLTQEAVADMLGAQRSTVSTTAKALRDHGILTYSRGRITILDRKALEARCCECYQTVNRHYAQVIPEAKPQKLYSNTDYPDETET